MPSGGSRPCRAQHRAPRRHGRLGLQPAGRGQVRLHPRYAPGGPWGQTGRPGTGPRRGRPGCHAPLSTCGRGGPRVPPGAGAAGARGARAAPGRPGRGRRRAGRGRCRLRAGQDLLSSPGPGGLGGVCVWAALRPETPVPPGPGLPSEFLLSVPRRNRGYPWFLEISLGIPGPWSRISLLVMLAWFSEARPWPEFHLNFRASMGGGGGEVSSEAEGTMPQCAQVVGLLSLPGERGTQKRNTNMFCNCCQSHREGGETHFERILEMW